MIYSLKGKLTEKLTDSVIIEVNDVGYQVFLTGTEINELLIDREVFVYTQLIISDDKHTLYGFLSAGSLALFKMLRNVNGVGPKTALNILNSGKPKSIITAISEADKSYFKSVTGVGPKSALKIIVDLQDKVGKLKDVDLTPKSKEEIEIVQALESMGYDRDRIETVLNDIDMSLSEKEKLQKAIVLLSNA